MKNRSIIIGLTGPIASGKSTAVKFFKRKGAFIINADEIGHKLLSLSSGEGKRIVKAFGEHILNKEGSVVRQKLAKIVFADETALRVLNKIIHPAIKHEVLELISQGKKKEKKLIVVDAAVLRRIGLLSSVDCVIVVIASMGKRIKRLISLGMSKQEAIERINSQETDKQYEQIADYVIHNNMTKVSMQKKLEKVIADLG